MSVVTFLPLAKNGSIRIIITLSETRYQLDTCLVWFLCTAENCTFLTLVQEEPFIGGDVSTRVGGLDTVADKRFPQVRHGSKLFVCSLPACEHVGDARRPGGSSGTWFQWSVGSFCSEDDGSNKCHEFRESHGPLLHRLPCMLNSPLLNNAKDVNSDKSQEALNATRHGSPGPSCWFSICSGWFTGGQMEPSPHSFLAPHCAVFHHLRPISLYTRPLGG